MPTSRRPPPPPPPRRRRRGITAAVVGVILVSAAAATWQATRRAAPPAPPPPAPAPVAPPPETAQPPEPPDPRPAFVAARATLSCAGRIGEAVFVAPERALGSLECPEGQGQLHLSDGRDLLGRAAPGAPAGTSVLDVPGAAAPFVPPGAATPLADGAPLLVGLEGAGPAVIGEASARGFAPVAGRPLLRIEDAGGAVAGPALDAAGNLVAIVPSIPADPDRPSLAVPVEAFAPSLGREAGEAWRGLAAQAADEERRAQGDLWGRLRGPAPILLAAVPAQDGLDLVVARAGLGRPPAESVALALAPLVPDCRLPGSIVEWRTGPGMLEGAPVPPPVAGQLARLVPPQGGGAVWIGRGHAAIECDLSRVADGATLAIPGGDPIAPVPFPRSTIAEALAEGARQAAEADRIAAQAAAQEQATRAEEEAAREMGWRNAFREANARVAQAKERVHAVQEERDAARGNFQYVLEEQLNGDLEAARLEVKRAEMALDDLDRRASLDAVPRAWRRE